MMLLFQSLLVLPICGDGDATLVMVVLPLSIVGVTRLS